MLRPPVGVGFGTEDGRDHAVRGPTVGGGRALVDGLAQQWMDEPDGAGPLQLQQRGRHDPVDGRAVDPPSGRGTGERLPVEVPVGRRHEECARVVGTELVGPGEERSSEDVAHRESRVERRPAAALFRAEVGGDLDERERIAPRRAPELFGDPRVDVVGEQERGVEWCEPGHVDRREVRCKPVGLAVALGQEQQHGLVLELSRGEEHGIARRTVGPLGSVDGHHERPGTGTRREQHRERGAEGRSRAGFGQTTSEQGPEDVAVLDWHQMQSVAQRRDDGAHERQRAPAIGFDPLDADHPGSPRVRDGPPQQCRLPAPGRAAQHSRRTRTGFGRLAEVEQLSTFGRSPDDHYRKATDWA